MNRMRGQGGWTVLEVAVASSIGAIVLAGAVTLTATATKGTESVSTQATLRREAGGFLDHFRDQISQSSIKHITLQDLSNGTTAIAYQTVITHRAGEPVWGGELRRVGEDVKPARITLEGLTVGVAGPIPANLMLEAWSMEFRAVTLGDGSMALFKLYLDPTNQVIFADLLAKNVTELAVNTVGDSIEVSVCIKSQDSDGEIREKALIVPRN